MNKLCRLVILQIILFASLPNIMQSSVLSETPFDEYGYQNIKLSTDKSRFDFQVEPSLALDGENVFVGFKNAYTHDGGGIAVSYTYSTDSITWSSPTYLEQFYAGSGQSDPWMVTFNHTLYYVYLEYPTTEVGQSQITLARTTDFGTTWELTRATYGTGFADKETFAIDENGYIYVAYDDIYTGDESDLFHTDQKLSRSFDGGESFVENVTMNDQFLDGYLAPYIVSGGSGVLYNLFSYIGTSPTESDIYFDKSLDYGETWGIDTDLNPSYNASSFPINPVSNRPTKSTIPSMRVDQNGVIYVVWADISEDVSSENWDVYMRFSDDTGITWSDRMLINENKLGDSWMPDLDIDSSGNVYIAYYDNNNLEDLSNLMYRVYYPDSNTLSDETLISSEGTPAEFTRLGDYITLRVDDNDKFHVVWTDGREGVLNIYYATDKLDKIRTAPYDTNSDNSKGSVELLWINLSIIVLMFRRRKT